MLKAHELFKGEVLPKRLRPASQAALNTISGTAGVISVFAYVRVTFVERRKLISLHSVGPFATGNWRGIFYTLAGIYGLAFVMFILMYIPFKPGLPAWPESPITGD